MTDQGISAGFMSPSSGQVVDVAALKRPLLRRVAAKARRGAAGMWWRQRLHSFRTGSTLQSPSSIFGGDMISLGSQVHVWHSARLEAFRSEPSIVRLQIGDDTVIQPFAHIGAAECIEIGRGVLMASHVYITDHDHDFSEPSSPVISNRRLVIAPVRIGDFVWLGERVMVLKGVTVGERSVIGAGSIVTRDIPPLSLAVGSPARVVRRYDAEQGGWLRVD